MQNVHEDSSRPGGIVLADSAYRARRFRTRTIQLREQGRDVVDKVAATDEAGPFLEQIPLRE